MIAVDRKFKCRINPNCAYAVPASRSFSPRHCDRFSRDWSVLGARIGLRRLQDDSGAGAGAAPNGWLVDLEDACSKTLAEDALEDVVDGVELALQVEGAFECGGG
jgi:hypothetical protein